MTGHPKQKITKARKGKRRSHLALPLPTLVSCPQCGQAKLPHRVCLSCGTYDGKQILTLPSKKKEKS